MIISLIADVVTAIVLSVCVWWYFFSETGSRGAWARNRNPASVDFMLFLPWYAGAYWVLVGWHFAVGEPPWWLDTSFMAVYMVFLIPELLALYRYWRNERRNSNR